MKKTLRDAQALDKIKALTPEKPTFLWWMPGNGSLNTEIEKAAKLAGYFINKTSYFTDSKGDYFVGMYSFGAMSPTAVYPEVGYMQPTIIVKNRNTKRKGAQVYLALHNPVTGAIYTSYYNTITNYWSSLGSFAGPRHSEGSDELKSLTLNKLFSIITNANSIKEFEQIYKSITAVGSSHIGKREAYNLFSNFYFGDLDKNGMTSSFATEIQKGYRELFKTPGDVFVEKIFDLYNKAILANCHPKDMVDNMQYINAHIYNLAVHDATKSLSDGKTVEKYINDLSHKITMTVDPLAIVTADLPVITSTTTTDLPF